MPTERTKSLPNPRLERKKLVQANRQRIKKELAERALKGNNQTIKQRLLYWFETKTVKEIQAIIDTPKVWDNLPNIDAALCRLIAAATKDGGSSALTMVLDRLLGKPAQAITGEDGKPLIPQADVNELARRTAFLLSRVVLPVVGSDSTLITIEQTKPLNTLNG